MNLAELINQNVSKKMGIAIVAMLCLVHVQAPSYQIMAVGIAAVIMQGLLDFRNPNNERKQA